MASASSSQDAAAATVSETDAEKLFAEELDTISDSQLATYKEAFAAFDSTGAGCISRTDLAACLRSVAIHATEKDLTRFADEAGLVVEATHSISYTHFLRVITSLLMASRLPTSILRYFEVFDPDRRGYITTAQCRMIFQFLGERPAAASIVDDLLAYADSDDTGIIFYERLIKKVVKDFTEAEKAKAYAKANPGAVAKKAAAKKGKKKKK